jgi:hypothetical protein
MYKIQNIENFKIIEHVSTGTGTGSRSSSGTGSRSSSGTGSGSRSVSNTGSGTGIAPTCPSGGVYSTTSFVCVQSSNPVCPTNSTWNSTLNFCTQNQTMVGGTYKCDTAFTLLTGTGGSFTPVGSTTSVTVPGICTAPANSCTSSEYKIDSNSGLCITQPTCATGKILNAATNKCQ